ncbi:hypothetical protein PUN28_018875 [Cardiocondyla obscurior]|uniref:Uncharacterized protein n=1 Tax=Cardiocondyla obscurior TaxID=286306 RepID=A0AAW2EGD7_9HYME
MRIHGLPVSDDERTNAEREAEGETSKRNQMSRSCVGTEVEPLRQTEYIRARTCAIYFRNSFPLS